MSKTKYLRETLLILLLFSGTLVIYWSLSREYSEKTRQYKSTLLGVDSFAVMRVLTDEEFVAKQHRTTAHPLFALFFKPAGSGMADRLGAPETARILNTSIAVAGILLFYILLRRMGISAIHSSLNSAILAGSASHILFGAIPETYAFASTSLILMTLIYVSFNKNKSFLAALFPASLLSLGITITNFVFACILIAARFFRNVSWTKFTLYIAGFSLAVAVFFLGLLKTQKMFYPTTRDFVSKQTYTSNVSFVSKQILRAPLLALKNRTTHLFVFNVVVPGMVRNKIMLPELSEITTLAKITTGVYLVFLGLASYLIVKFRIYHERIFLALLAYFAFSLVFYLIYGDEPHLYTSHYTFALVGMLAFPFRPGNQIPQSSVRWLTVLAIILVPLLFFSNGKFLLNLLLTI